jgi:hypothetical protein
VGDATTHHRHSARPISPLRPQANDSDDDNDDGSAGNELTASLDDDDCHVAGLVWKRLIVTAMATLVTGDQVAMLEDATTDGSALGSCLTSTSLRSLNVCLQI